MNKFLLILLLSLFYFSKAHSLEYDWENIVKKNTPNITLNLSSQNPKEPKELLSNRVIGNMYVQTEDAVLNNEYYFFKEGCRPHSCPEKGVVWIDKKKKVFIGLVVHKYFEDTQTDKSKSWFDLPKNYLFFSSSIKSFEEIPIEFWMHFKKLEKNRMQFGYGNPETVRFIGNDKQVINVTAIFEKKIKQ